MFRAEIRFRNKKPPLSYGGFLFLFMQFVFCRGLWQFDNGSAPLPRGDYFFIAPLICLV
jgi:hypothetical protein